MRILFISYLFQPNSRIGAVRPSNMARYLAEFGHDVTVLCCNEQGQQAAETASLYHVDHSRWIRRGREKVAATVKARHTAGIKPQGYSVKQSQQVANSQKLKNAFRVFRVWAWDWLQQVDWFFQCKRFCRENLKKDFDVILSSYGPYASLWLGAWARRKKYAPVWVSDLRDPIVNSVFPDLVNHYNRAIERNMLRRADKAVCVSDGVLEHYRKSLPSRQHKLICLENGFECGVTENTAPADGVLRIGYTGGLYTDRSDFTALLQAMSRLTAGGRVPPGGMELHYAGPHSQEFMGQVELCGMEQAVVNHGMLQRQEALAVQSSSDILCVLSWNTQEAQGILTGKFWEYLRAEKPVLSLVTGDVPGAELTRRIGEMQLGFGYEYCDPDDRGLEDFLYHVWQSKSRGEAIPFTPVREKVLDYRYDNRARYMETICMNAISENRRSRS